MAAKLTRYSKRIYERMRGAGYSAKDAHFIASEQQAALDEGITVEWEEDRDADRSDEEPDYALYCVIARNEVGDVVDSLCGVDLGEVGPDAHHSDPYQYDAEAQVINGGRA